MFIFLLFGYQKWWEYEAQTLIPFIRNGPLTSWMYPVFGLHGASWFLGVSEWLTAALLIWGFWNPRAGILGAILSVATFVTTVTIIPFPARFRLHHRPAPGRGRRLPGAGPARVESATGLRRT